MSTDIKIETVKLRVAGKELELTLEQARELKTVLEDLFPSPVSTSDYPRIREASD